MTFLSTTPHHFAEHLCTPWGWRCGANPPGSRNVAPSQQCEHIVEDLTFVATRIYHVPVWASYAKTRIDTAKGERWFCSEAVARRRGGDERSGDALRLHFFAGPLQLIIPPPAVTTRTAISPDAGTGKG